MLKLKHLQREQSLSCWHLNLTSPSLLWESADDFIMMRQRLHVCRSRSRQACRPMRSAPLPAGKLLRRRRQSASRQQPQVWTLVCGGMCTRALTRHDIQVSCAYPSYLLVRLSWRRTEQVVQQPPGVLRQRQQPGRAGRPQSPRTAVASRQRRALVSRGALTTQLDCGLFLSMPHSACHAPLVKTMQMLQKQVETALMAPLTGKKKENEDGMTIRKAEDFGRWYSELVVKSEMIDYSDISGMLSKPTNPQDADSWSGRSSKHCPACRELLEWIAQDTTTTAPLTTFLLEADTCHIQAATSCGRTRTRSGTRSTPGSTSASPRWAWRTATSRCSSPRRRWRRRPPTWRALPQRWAAALVAPAI